MEQVTIWSALAERSGDSALDCEELCTRSAIQSGVAAALRRRTPNHKLFGR